VTAFSSGRFTALRFVPVDGRTLLVGCSDEAVHVWDAATGAELYPPLPDSFRSYDGVPVATVGGRPVVVVEANTTTSGHRRWSVHDLATGDVIGEVTVPKSEFDTESAATVAEVGGRGVLLVADGSDVVLVDLATGARVGTPLSGHEAPPHGMVAVPIEGGSVLLTGAYDQSVRVWDLTARSGR
jgi:WD40 repeat protein